VIVVKRILIGVSLALVVAVVALLIGAEGLYRYALSELGTPPAAQLRPSGVETAAFWLHAGESGPYVIEPLSPWRLAAALALSPETALAPKPGSRAASLAARVWLGDPSPYRRARWPLMFWAATVWASRHWDAAQMTQVWLGGAWYGRNARGLTAAAKAYFGKRREDLAIDELALLVAITNAPARLDPACYPDRSVSARNRLLDNLLSAGAISRSDYEGGVARSQGASRSPVSIDAGPCHGGPVPARYTNLNPRFSFVQGDVRPEPYRVADPYVREPPLGDEPVDRRPRNPEPSGHLGHRQQAVDVPECQQQTSSKLPTKSGEIGRSAGPGRIAVASVSERLRTLTTLYTPSDSAWGASGRWFKSSRPDHLTGRHPSRIG
jgi:hypothetical protein